MKRCIVHIGMHKTGSTSIQRSLQGYSDDRFLYAGLDIPNHSLAMHTLFASHPERYHIHVAHGRDAAGVAEYAARVREDLERSIAGAGDRTLVISGEAICLLPPDALARLREDLRPRFDELTVVGYVRPPGGFMSSIFQQRVKGGSAVQFAPERQYRSYRKHFGALDEIFGRENVRLWKFDPAAFPDGCAVRDFCSRLGIALPAEKIIRFNESLTRTAVALLYTYGKLREPLGFRIMRAPEGQRIGNLFASAGNDRFRLSPDIITPVLERNRADIAWMEARLGQSLDEDLGAHRPGDVRDEADLLEPDPRAVGRLLALLGTAAPAGNRGETPGDVARLVHALREKIAAPAVRSPFRTFAGRLLGRLRTYASR